MCYQQIEHDERNILLLSMDHDIGTHSVRESSRGKHMGRASFDIVLCVQANPVEAEASKDS